MHWFDLLVFGVLLLAIGIGFWRGILQETLAFISWPLALFLANTQSHIVTEHLPEWTPSVSGLVARLVIVIAVLVVMTLCRWLIGIVTTAIGKTILSRLLGALLGLIKQSVVISFVVLIMSFSSLPETDFWFESHTVRIFGPMNDWMTEYLTDDTKSTLLSLAEQADETQEVFEEE